MEVVVVDACVLGEEAEDFFALVLVVDARGPLGLVSLVLREEGVDLEGDVFDLLELLVAQLLFDIRITEDAILEF